MSDAPQTAEELVAWFTATEIVRHDGSRDPREPLMQEDEARLLAAKVGQTTYYNPHAGQVWEAELVWNAALERGLFMGRQYGWLDPKGRFWTCGYAAHDILLHFLDLSTDEAEDKGWLRITMTGVHGIYQPTAAQFRALVEDLGMEGAAKRLLDEGFKPGSMKRKT